jgi:hypothetical protein
MTEIALWEDVWDVINEEFTLLASQVLAAAPDKRWLAHHFDNEQWALSGTASFMPRDDPAADEDLVVTVQAYRSGGVLVWESDILAGGDIVSEGPRCEVPAGTALIHWAPEAVSRTRDWILAATADVVSYLRDGTPFPS